MAGKNIYASFALVIVAALAAFSASSDNSYAAEVHGTVYDIELNEADGAIIEISTQPKQQKVAKNSTYSFYAAPGSYAISAKKYDNGIISASAEENITIKEEGSYVIDLILFPSMEEEEQIISDADFSMDADGSSGGPGLIAVAALIISVAAFFLIIRLREKDIKKEKAEISAAQGDEKEVLDFIRKQGGRTTQKEIRESFPQSEAKISLIISQLESEGRLKKIKKGRGNIIIIQNS